MCPRVHKGDARLPVCSRAMAPASGARGVTRREPGLVYLAVLPVIAAIILASNSEPLFHSFGFLVCLGSVAGRALKSVVQGLLSSEVEHLNSMSLLLYTAPIAATLLLPFSLFMEGRAAATTLTRAREDPRLALLLIGNATVVYLVNLTNFLVTKHTSALTLQVLDNAKAAVAAVDCRVLGHYLWAIMRVVLYSEAKKRCGSPPPSSSSLSTSS